MGDISGYDEFLHRYHAITDEDIAAYLDRENARGDAIAARHPRLLWDRTIRQFVRLP